VVPFWLCLWAAAMIIVVRYSYRKYLDSQ
jgi:hypothetical protein